jgi:mRNA interferase RelE/StbE
VADERYEIRFTRSAERDLGSLPRQAAQVRIARVIDRLADTPRPRGAKLLAAGGPPRIYRIRVGDYRILYEPRDDELVIVVIAAGQRREAYRSGR